MLRDKEIIRAEIEQHHDAIRVLQAELSAASVEAYLVIYDQRSGEGEIVALPPLECKHSKNGNGYCLEWNLKTISEVVGDGNLTAVARVNESAREHDGGLVRMRAFTSSEKAERCLACWVDTVGTKEFDE